MIPTNKTVEIYYLVDEFLKEYDAVIKRHSLEEGAAKKRRNRKFTMSGSEVMTILILFGLRVKYVPAGCYNTL